MERIIQELQNELDGWKTCFEAEKFYYKGHEHDKEAIKSFAECEEMIKEYSQAIKILKEHNVSKSIIGSLPLIDAGSSLEDLRTDSQIKYHCPRCKERVYYPMDCRVCFKEIIWKGNDR